MNSAESTGEPMHAENQAEGADDQREAHSDFQPTQSDSLEPGAPDWWPESADGQCSQSAALFAASQPAPLNVV